METAVYRKTIFCDFEFLRKFGEENPLLNDNVEHEDIWNDIHRFIKNSLLVLNKSREELRAYFEELKTNSGDALALNTNFIWRLFKKYQCQFTYKDDDDYVDWIRCQTSDICLKSVFMLDTNKAEGDMYERKYGRIVFTPATWSEKGYLFSDNFRELGVNERCCWQQVFDRGYQLDRCNSIVIVDPYLRSTDIVGADDGDGKSSRNLYDILSCILPETLSVPLHISIFTENKKGLTNYHKKYKKICGWIGVLRPKLDFTLGVYSTSGDLHDRCILTNNVVISCGAGFDLFKIRDGKPCNQTSVTIVHPGIIDNTDRTEELLSLIRRICANVRESKGGEMWPKDNIPPLNRMLV